MKKALSLILCLAMALALLPPGAAAAEGSPFDGGSGTAEDPYLVSTPEQLAAVDDYPDSCFLQVNDIDLSSASFTSIYSFSGTYDGGGNCISGLTNSSGFELFSSNSGTIQNLGLADSSFSDSYFSRSGQRANLTIGGLVGINYGVIQNCYASNVDVQGSGTLRSEYPYASITVTAGVLTAINSGGGVIRNCYVTGSVTAGSSCSATGPQTEAAAICRAGGVAGYNAADAVIDNCYSTCTVRADASGSPSTVHKGPVCGDNSGDLTHSYYTNSSLPSTGDSYITEEELKSPEFAATLNGNINPDADAPRYWAQDPETGTVVLNMQNLDLTVNHPSGVYDMSDPLPLTLEGVQPDSDIYYSTSGTASHMQLYTQPIELTENTPVLVRIQHAEDVYRVRLLSYRAALHPVKASPAPGVYGEPFQVALTAGDPSAEIYYTTDGSDPVTGGIRYQAPFWVFHNTVVTAAAKVDGVFGDPLAFEYQVSPAITADYPGGSYTTPIFVTLSSQVPQYEIYYTVDGDSDPREHGIKYTGPIEIFKTTKLQVASTYNGAWSAVSTFQYTYPEVTITPSLSEGEYGDVFLLSLSCDTPFIDLSYSFNGENEQAYTAGEQIPIYKTANLTVFARYNSNLVTQKVLRYTLPEPVISASPDAGSYGQILSISLACNIPSYELYYTLDGSDPSVKGVRYAGPFELDHTATLNVCAKYRENVVANRLFAYNLSALPYVTADPAPGDYTAPLTVTLTSSEEFYDIYYTTDGSDPRTNGVLYERPIEISKPADTLIRAVPKYQNVCGTASSFRYTFDSQSFTVTNIDVVKRADYMVSLDASNKLLDSKSVSFYIAAYSDGKLLDAAVRRETLEAGENRTVEIALPAKSELPDNAAVKVFCLDSATQKPFCEPSVHPVSDIPKIQELHAISVSPNPILGHSHETGSKLVVTAHYTNGKPDQTVTSDAIITIGDPDANVVRVSYPSYELAFYEAGSTTLTVSYTEDGITKTAVVPVTVEPSRFDLGFLANPTADPLPADAIPISTAEELAAIGGAGSEGKTYYLANDIRLTGEWDPIYNFRGTLDGRGHAVKGLYILPSSGEQLAGLFASAYGAVIKNLAVEIDGRGVTANYPSESDFTYSGGLVADAGNTSIINCCTTGGPVAADGSATYAGGLVGYITQSSAETITNCYSTCNVSATTRRSISTNTTMAGGLIGFLRGSSAAAKTTVSRCYAAGDAKALYTEESTTTQIGLCAGGLIASVRYAEIRDCFAQGTVEGRHQSASGAPICSGGLFGSGSGVDLHSCYAAPISVNAYAPSGSGCNAYMGGLYGDGSDVTGTFYCYRMSGQHYGYGNVQIRFSSSGTDLMDDEAKDPAEYFYFDFDSTWQFTPGAFRALPHLQYDPN